MKSRRSRSNFTGQLFYTAIAIECMALPLPSQSVLAQAQQAQSQAMTSTKEAPKIPNDQLDSLVAPIALYPDSLLSQTLVASTYPLEIIQLQQWLEQNKNLKGQALADAVKKQHWDPSVQAMAAFPDVVQKLADNIQWTTNLGNAFLAQQPDLMNAVQQMRAKAQGTGNLKTTAQQKVETQTVEGGKQVIVIQLASPNIVYVPTYDPVVVFGPPVFPYPPLLYPPGYYAGMALSFGAGFALGAVWGGGWGWGFGWGGGNVTINNNNTYINNYNIHNHRFYGHNGRWHHDPQHRGGAPYSRASALQVRHELAARETGAERNRFGGGGERRPGGEARPGEGGNGERSQGGEERRGRGGEGDRIGDRRVSPDSGFGSRHNAFGGGREFRGRDAWASSRRGEHSWSRGGHREGGYRRGGHRRG
jgi:hypothetical protein